MRQIRQITWSLLLILSVFHASLQAQSRSQNLQKWLPSIMDSTGIPGLSIALIENGQLTWSDGYGVKNKATQELVSATTIFQGASLGKPLFAYAVLKLSQEGKIPLDAPLINYVSKTYLEAQFLKGPMSDDRVRLITARMLLAHTSGLPNWRTEDKPLTIMFQPGSRYSYSGEGYYLLQQVVEYVVGEPIESFMQRTVFKPLGMNHTSYGYNPNVLTDYANSYNQMGTLVGDNNEPVNVAHTLRTTAADYARFLIGTLMTQAPQDQSANALVSAQVNTDICQIGQVYWGLGMAIQHRPAGDLFCQWAKSPTASGYVIGSAEQKTALIYLVNVANQGLRIAERVVKLGLDYDDPLFACFGVRPYNQRP